MIIVPKRIDENVFKLIGKLTIHDKPFYVEVKPENECKINECFPNVKSKISKDGGEIIFGWTIWQHNFMLEAEFHSIWKSPNGEFIDITPKQNHEKRILFVIDKIKRYENKQVDNARLRIIDNKLADDFIALAVAKFYILNEGERANNNGEVLLMGKEADMYEYLNSLMVSVNNMLLRNQTRNSPCFCESGRKYKNCHGQDLIEKLKK